jgi:hypothetical protein
MKPQPVAQAIGERPDLAPLLFEAQILLVAAPSHATASIKSLVIGSPPSPRASSHVHYCTRWRFALQRTRFPVVQNARSNSQRLRRDFISAGWKFPQIRAQIQVIV